MSDLDLLMEEREVIMLAGGQGSGKSYSVAKLVEKGADEGFQVFIIDRDRGLSKVLRGLFGKNMPDNLEYYLIREWDDIYTALNEAHNLLGPGDWLVFEHIGRLWDRAQEAFAEKVYGGLTDHLLAARVDAEATIRTADLKDKEATRVRAKEMGFQGMEGRYDWPLIKRMHNTVFDKAVLEGQYNVLSTTSVTPLQDTDVSKGKWPEFHSVGIRPEGEKHQVYRHETVAISYQRDGRYMWRTDLGKGIGKDRERELVRDIDFTDTGFVQSYGEYHAL